MTVKIAQKRAKHGPKNGARIAPQNSPKPLKMGSKRYQNDPKMMPKRCLRDPNATPDRPKNGPSVAVPPTAQNGS